tara:strand:+ start:1558 stop:1725 length:168 start_codon:yes stop_codon:yes gene_type:complete
MGYYNFYILLAELNKSSTAIKDEYLFEKKYESSIVATLPLLVFDPHHPLSLAVRY